MNDNQTESSNSENRSDQSKAQPSTQPIFEQQSGDEEKPDTESGENHTEDATDPVLPLAGWRARRIVRWWNDPFRSRGNFPEHLTVVISIVIAIIAGFQWNVYRQQKRIMESSGQQTQQLIDAANVQAGAACQIAAAADKNAVAADSFSKTADRIDTKIKSVERDFSKMAKNSSESLKESVQIFQAANRAWLTMKADPDFVPAIPGSSPINIIVKNVGQSPAFAISNFFVDYAVVKIEPNGHFVLPYPPPVQSPGGGTFVPGDFGVKSPMITITLDQAKDLMQPNYHIIVFGRVDYAGQEILGKREHYWTIFCESYHTEGTLHWRPCIGEMH